MIGSDDAIYMKRCIELARNGSGTTAPNPMVGSVIVHKGLIIGEGYHRQCGESHAEVNAIKSVKNPSLLKESTIYVNLEPCSHYGKTPPCSDFIVENQIPRVVVGQVDINPRVSGRGIRRMEQGGCQVRVGVLEGECLELNKRFIKFHEQKRPYVILKWAQSYDGFIDIERNDSTPPGPAWINDELDLTLVHKWRTEEQSIMVGTTTALNDNPKLNARHWLGNSPLRLVLDRHLRLPADMSLFDGSLPTIVFTAHEKASKPNLFYEQIDFDTDIFPQMMEVLYRKNIQSLIVEGGTTLLTTFLEQGLWDEIRLFVGHKHFHKGLKAPIFNGHLLSEDMLSSSTLYVYENPAQRMVTPY